MTQFFLLCNIFPLLAIRGLKHEEIYFEGVRKKLAINTGHTRNYIRGQQTSRDKKLCSGPCSFRNYCVKLLL